MGSRGPPYDGRATQAPGIMRHGPAQSSVHMPYIELLTNRVTAQAAEIETVLRENQKLAATNAAMRKEVRANLEEVQRIKSHIGSIHIESDIQVRGLVDKLRKIDDDIKTSDTIKEELTKARKEANALITIKEELTIEHQISEESIKAAVDCKILPKLLVQLEELNQEHQKLRVIFEHEKESNKEQVELLHILERNLISTAREVEKLRADVINAKTGGNTAAKLSGGICGDPSPLHPGLIGNSNVETVQDNSTAYTQPYGYPTSQLGLDFLRPQV